uniref:Centrosomal protein of 19 kDa n=1 Tax=Euplotes harpa TaxID=151035 RepID=A0A7S3JLW0_9SPIT|mmetsp:Transcript_8683/g.9861  ORF Transcript_8683/g.9861 Transcript_8683/m.9861 type:complete len:251 (+) Transcript_8683:2-754(+)
MEVSKMNGKIIPTNFGLKYDPPKLGIQYYIKENPKATFVHEVDMSDIETKKVDDLISDLFTKHKKFIDPKVVSRNQLENLMERLKSNVSERSISKDKPAEKAGLAKNNVEKENVINNRHEKLEKNVKANPIMSPIESKVPEKPKEAPMKSQKIEKDFFEDMKHSKAKDLSHEDFEFDSDHQKLNDSNEILDGLDYDAGEKDSKGQDDHHQEDEEESNNFDGDNHNENEDEGDSEAIDIDNEEELAARGLK